MKKLIGSLSAAILVLASASGLFAAETKVVQVTAQKYNFTPGTITVHQGDKVILEATATDTDHGLAIEAFHINQPLLKNQKVTIEFVADRKGKFTIKCNKFCGLGHPWMTGTLEVI